MASSEVDYWHWLPPAPNGLGGVPAQQRRMLDSGGCQIVLRYVMSDKSAVVRFQKSGCCLAVPMLVAVTPRCAAVTVPALSTIKCYRPAALVASPSNQDGWFAAFAGVFEPVPVSLHEACVICMFVM